ncbi:enoyl-(Acyl carrier protein) reductase domain-containing protein [Phthorimaea operculella]|nr:enoyl-(Acyl carrier protein) reductase domain-containing protein [Phthorimaea operculella]
MSFKNKVILVTGASSGIGANIAINFATEGGNVVIVGRNQKKLDEVAAKISAVGSKPLVINADVSKNEDAKRIITKTVSKFGKLDVLVNNAGIGKKGFIADGSIVEAYDVIMNVNVRAVINLTTLAAPHLVASKGNIVNISSVASMCTVYGFLPYSVSKAALDHFTRGAALELSPKGIRVNSVNPGPIETNFLVNAELDVTWDDLKAMTALKRLSDVEEIADLVAYLASDKARGITGSCFVNDNGVLLR